MIRKMGEGGIEKKSYSLPLISVGERIAMKNAEKAEMLAEVFVKGIAIITTSEDKKEQSRKENRHNGERKVF